MAESFERRQSFQTIAWFRDLYSRGLLDLDPPYQRRSVWNQEYRNFFIETILLRYPAPAIFVHEAISPEGSAKYSVVDGKQRLTTILDFADGVFPVAEDSILKRMAGVSFANLPDPIKQAFWTYQFSVEYLPTTDEATLTNVFDRINRNVARLQRQELRHARFGGAFASAAERANDLLVETFGLELPRIAISSRRQMKDVEMVAQLLLFLENGPQTFSQDDLDEAYSSREQEWPDQAQIESRFHRTVRLLVELTKDPSWTAAPMRRLRNQADFYSLFGAYAELERENAVPVPSAAAGRLLKFVTDLASDERRIPGSREDEYYSAARAASNDLRQRGSRIRIIKQVLAEG